MLYVVLKWVFWPLKDTFDLDTDRTGNRLTTNACWETLVAGVITDQVHLLTWQHPPPLPHGSAPCQTTDTLTSKRSTSQSVRVSHDEIIGIGN